jgi:hypothetical protein
MLAYRKSAHRERREDEPAKTVHAPRASPADPPAPALQATNVVSPELFCAHSFGVCAQFPSAHAKENADKYRWHGNGHL